MLLNMPTTLSSSCYTPTVISIKNMDEIQLKSQSLFIIESSCYADLRIIFKYQSSRTS